MRYFLSQQLDFIFYGATMECHKIFTFLRRWIPSTIVERNISAHYHQMAYNKWQLTRVFWMLLHFLSFCHFLPFLSGDLCNVWFNLHKVHNAMFSSTQPTSFVVETEPNCDCFTTTRLLLLPLNDTKSLKDYSCAIPWYHVDYLDNYLKDYLKVWYRKSGLMLQQLLKCLFFSHINMPWHALKSDAAP